MTPGFIIISVLNPPRTFRYGDRQKTLQELGLVQRLNLMPTSCFLAGDHIGPLATDVRYSLCDHGRKIADVSFCYRLSRGALKISNVPLWVRCLGVWLDSPVLLLATFSLAQYPHNIKDRQRESIRV